jgi:hypothetical protein
MLYQLSYRGSVEGVPITSGIVDCKAETALPNPSSRCPKRQTPELYASALFVYIARQWGLVAEWLRRGLQILVRGFDSLRGLQLPPALSTETDSSKPRQLQRRPARVDADDRAEQVDLNALHPGNRQPPSDSRSPVRDGVSAIHRPSAGKSLPIAIDGRVTPISGTAARTEATKVFEFGPGQAR